jgi:hypothetical protein
MQLPLISERLTRRRGAALPRNGHVREVPVTFHVIGLWIGVDKMLAPSRETVKI